MSQSHPALTGTVIILGLAGALAIYGLDHGIYVGSDREVVLTGMGHHYIQKRCSYFFVTGISEIDAHDGRIEINVGRLVDELSDEPSRVGEARDEGYTDREIFEYFVQRYREAGRTAQEINDLIAAKFPDDGYCMLFGPRETAIAGFR